MENGFSGLLVEIYLTFTTCTTQQTQRGKITSIRYVRWALSVIYKSTIKYPGILIKYPGIPGILVECFNLKTKATVAC